MEPIRYKCNIGKQQQQHILLNSSILASNHQHTTTPSILISQPTYTQQGYIFSIQKKYIGAVLSSLPPPPFKFNQVCWERISSCEDGKGMLWLWGRISSGVESEGKTRFKKNEGVDEYKVVGNFIPPCNIYSKPPPHSCFFSPWRKFPLFSFEQTSYPPPRKLSKWNIYILLLDCIADPHGMIRDTDPERQNCNNKNEKLSYIDRKNDQWSLKEFQKSGRL